MMWMFVQLSIKPETVGPVRSHGNRRGGLERRKSTPCYRNALIEFDDMNLDENKSK